MDFLIHWPPGPVVATVQCQGLLLRKIFAFSLVLQSGFISSKVTGYKYCVFWNLT